MTITTITIEFDSDDYEHLFIADVKKGVEWSKFKPSNLTMTTREKFE